MFVNDILKRKGSAITSVTAGQPIAEALALMAQHRIGAVLVVDGAGGIAGILSERDLVRAMNKNGKAVFDRTVGDLMTSPVVTCTPKDPVGAIEGMMTAQRFRHVPVVEDGKIVGIVSIGDVVKTRIEEAEAEVDALRRYIAL
ncbi:MAG: CBS domain-containing protein [Rhodospirillales bacterium]|nr:CBS domain-containing protein [Rhodospirillales bacterium]